METEKKHSGKRSAMLVSWDEARGFGFCSARNPRNPSQHQSWFIHASRIIRVEDPSGVIRTGEQVFFNEESHPKGMMAVDCEILSLTTRIQRNAVLQALTGKNEHVGYP